MLMFPDLVDVDENSGVEFNKNVQNLTAAVAWPVKEKTGIIQKWHNNGVGLLQMIKRKKDALLFPRYNMNIFKIKAFELTLSSWRTKTTS